MKLDTLISTISELLTARRASVEQRSDSVLEVSKRNAVGKTARAQLDLEALAKAIADDPEGVDAACWMASYVEGVDRALCTFKSRLVERMGFHEAAGRLVMRLEGPGFALGHVAAGGPQPYLKPWHAGLSLCYWVEMDHFVLVLSEEKVEGWGITHDRLHSAARSILFHKTRYEVLETGEEGAESYRVGDGYDASRALVLADVDFHRCRSGVLIGIPSQSRMMVVDRESTDASTFARDVAKVYASADYPLCPELFTVERSKLERV